MIYTYDSCCPVQTECECGGGIYPSPIMYVSFYDKDPGTFGSNPSPSALHGLTFTLTFDPDHPDFPGWYGEGVDNQDRAISFRYVCENNILFRTNLYMTYCTAGEQALGLVQNNPDGSLLITGCSPFVESYLFWTVGELNGNCQGDEFFEMIVIVHEGQYEWP